MKVIISEEHINKLKSLIEKYGIDSLGIEPHRLIEMGVVEHYDGDLDLRDTPIKSLGNLTSIKNDLNLTGTPIESLGKLKSVGGYLNLYKSKIKSLGNLEEVGDSLDLEKTKIKSLGNLVYVGKNLFIMNTPKLHMSDEEIRSQIEIKGEIYR
jgi:hypothetical protein